MSGIPYWSTDIGGFFGGDPKDPAYAQLFVRWYEFAAFTPMFRVHGTGAGPDLLAYWTLTVFAIACCPTSIRRPGR